MKHYLAFDLGADSGRAVLGTLDNSDRLTIKEVNRFPNRMVQGDDGNLHWDVNTLYEAMISSLRTAGPGTGSSLASIGIDTWGVDFALLDESGNLLDNPLTYRNHATTSRALMEDFLKIIPRDRLYQLTGIQIQPFNTIFQLYSLRRRGYLPLKRAASLLFMPDLFNFLFTGTRNSEYTVATTSQIFNPRTLNWEKTLIEALGIEFSLFQTIVPPGTIIGSIKDDLKHLTGLRNTPVIAVASHDTASAVAAAPASDDNFAFISCGTWSLMGIISPDPIINKKSFEFNFTNEGGIFKTFRILKNINGLWLIQRLQRDWDELQGYPVPYLVNLAQKVSDPVPVIDPDNPCFFNPVNMPEAIRDFCRKTGQKVPQEPGQYIKTILISLALAYRHTIEQLREISYKEIKRIHIMGGGSQNQLLCQFTADATKLPVYAGPVEATAAGNILLQIAFFKGITEVERIREISRNSFSLQIYQPERSETLEDLYRIFEGVKNFNNTA